MFSIANLVERAKAGAGIDSDYRLAKVIGITHASVSTWRMGKSLPNEKVIEQLCALSGDDPGVIAAEIQAARSKSPEARNLWLKVAARMSGRVSTAFLSVVITIFLIAAGAMNARASEVKDLQFETDTGRNVVACDVGNALVLSRGLSRSFESAQAKESARLARLVAIADTGAANDPLCDGPHGSQAFPPRPAPAVISACETGRLPCVVVSCVP